MAISISITCDGCGSTETISTSSEAQSTVSLGLMENGWTHGGLDSYCHDCANNLESFETMIGVTASKQYARQWLDLLGKTIPFGDPCADPHKSVMLDCVEVNTKIAPLVALCWRFNISTWNSCQGDPDLHERWTRYAPNNGNAAQDHQAYLTLSSFEEAVRVSTAIESFSAAGKSWRTSITINSPGTASEPFYYYFLHFPGEVLDEEWFMPHVEASLHLDPKEQQPWR